MNIDEIRTKDGKLPHYAWPGGYPMFYLDENCSVLCPDCANDETKLAPWEKIEAYAVNWEDDSLYCDDCGERIESAYAEEEE